MPIHTAFMLRTITCLLLFVGSFAAAAEDLPTPDSLRPAVDFWTRVYTEVDSHAGLVHDSVHLGVVYETLRFSEGISRRARERRTESAKRKIRDILRTLAKGKRTGLSADEARVLAQWPEGVTNATLREASGNLRFQLGLADRFRAGLVRSGRWRRFVERALMDHGVPLELVALPHVESSYNPKAYSRVGAAGMWQFTRSTGRLFMRIDSVVDERLDPYIASKAAARLLSKNHEITGVWPLAITAYNHGAAGMRRAARKLGTTDIGEIVRRYRSRTFGFASRNFYASFLAAARIDRDPSRYFGAITQHEPNAYTELELPWFTPAGNLAAALGVDLGVLRQHNPALRPAVWNGNKHVPSGYKLRLPAGTLAKPAETLIAAIPQSARHSAQHRDRYHKVRRGETLSRIARRYGVRESELVALNNLRSRHRIRVGQVLVLPGGSGGSQVARQPAPSDGVYRVRRGDSLGIIAKRFGVSERSLASTNGIRNRHRIQVGQRLRIPGAVQVATAKPAPAPEAKPQASPPPAPAEPPPATPAPETPAPRATATPETPPATATAAPETPPATATATPEPPPAPLAALPDAEPGGVVGLPAADTGGVIGLPAAEPEPAPAGSPEIVAEPATPPAAHADASSRPDPSDYAVHGNRITVQAAETLGHYADWLEIRASQLRRLNGMRYEQPVVIGRSLKLDFGRVKPDEFEQRRLEYHQSLQNEFFEAFAVTGTERHVLRRGESLWYLAKRKYQVPVWLLRQYNPDLDFAALPAGAPLIVPLVEPKTG